MKPGLFLLAGAALLASPAWAQRTVIVPDAQGSAMAAGTTVHTSGAITTIDGGTQAGTNLFHSFITFNLGSGDTARWTTTLIDPAKVTNVINRVTGGEISKINGTLDSSDLPRASFFFINPSGIIIGQHARVNVPGAAWFSTGKTLRFTDGSAFSATTAMGSTFSVAAPKSFGFLGQEGNITLKRAPALMANAEGGLGLLAANVQVEDVKLFANQIVMAAIGPNAADFALRGGDASSANLGGTLRIARSKLTISPSADDAGIRKPGQMTLRAGKIEISGGKFASNGGCVSVDKCTTKRTSGSISMSAGQIALRKGFVLTTSTFGPGRAGNLQISADTLTMQDSTIRSQTVGCQNGQCVAGNAGTVYLDAARLKLQHSKILTLSYNAAPAGAIQINAPQIEILDRSLLSTSTYGAGHAGNLDIHADTLTMKGSTIRSESICQTSQCVSGNAGTVSIDAALLMAQGSTISTRSYTAAPAGAINIQSQQVELVDGTVLSTSGLGAGPAGNLAIRADTLTMQDSRILSQTIGCQTAECASGKTGKIFIDGALLKMLRSNISTRSKSSSPAGAIEIHSRRVEILGKSAILSDALQGNGAAGSITIDLPNADGIVRLGIGGRISTSSTLEQAGRININAPLAIISNGSSILANGQEGGFVTIASRYFIRSSDRPNRISANGSVAIDSNLYDVSVGIAVPRIEYLDASNVLLGQCASARVTGVTSQLRWHNTGPYTGTKKPVRGELGAYVDLLDNPLC